MANPHRGEVEIELGGETYILRPTFHALVEIEERLGEGIVALTSRLSRGDIRLKDVATILHAGMRAVRGTKVMPYEELGRLVVAHGFTSTDLKIVEFLTGAFGDRVQEKKAETETPAT